MADFYYVRSEKKLGMHRSAQHVLRHGVGFWIKCRYTYCFACILPSTAEHYQICSTLIATWFNFINKTYFCVCTQGGQLFSQLYIRYIERTEHIALGRFSTEKQLILKSAPILTPGLSESSGGSEYKPLWLIGSASVRLRPLDQERQKIRGNI
jgi:hypothetical protein